MKYLEDLRRRRTRPGEGERHLGVPRHSGAGLRAARESAGRPQDRPVSSSCSRLGGLSPARLVDDLSGASGQVVPRRCRGTLLEQYSHERADSMRPAAVHSTGTPLDNSGVRTEVHAVCTTGVESDS